MDVKSILMIIDEVKSEFEAFLLFLQYLLFYWSTKIVTEHQFYNQVLIDIPNIYIYIVTYQELFIIHSVLLGL